MSVDEKTACAGVARAGRAAGPGAGPCAGAHRADHPDPRGMVLLRGDGRASGRGALPAGQPDPSGRDPGRGPVPDLVDRQPGAAAAAERGPPGAALRLLGRSAGRRLHAGERPAVDRRPGPVHGRLAGAGRSRGGGRGAHAPGLLPPGARQRPRPDALAGRQPQARQVPLPRPRPGNPCALRPGRAAGHDPAGRRDLSSIPGSASSPGAGSSCSGRRARTGWASGTTARRSRRNTTGCAITARATARAGSTGGPRPAGAS